MSFYHGIDLLKLESHNSFVFTNFGLAPISILLDSFCMPAAFSRKSIRGNSLNRSCFFSNPSKRLLTKEVILPLLLYFSQFALSASCICIRFPEDTAAKERNCTRISSLPRVQISYHESKLIPCRWRVWCLYHWLQINSGLFFIGQIFQFYPYEIQIDPTGPLKFCTLAYLVQPFYNDLLLAF